MSFYALQVSFEQIYHAFAQKLDKLFWATVLEVTSALMGKKLEHLEDNEILCVHSTETLTSSSVQGHKVLKEWIQCLCLNVVNSLRVATSHSTNNRRVQTLRLNKNQQALIRDPTVH